MKKTLKLHEILNLHIELNGYTDPQSQEIKFEGLLNQNLSHTIKYQLKSIAKKITAEKLLIDETQNELIKTYGTEDRYGNVGLNMFLDEKDENEKNIINPNFISYQEEWNKFLSDNEVEIDIISLKLDDLKDIKTKDNYRLIDEYFIINEPTE